jgi:hypothetical protein
MLASGAGLLGPGWYWLGLAGGAAWLALVEVVHRQRKTATGIMLAKCDRGLRYAVMAGLFGSALMLADWPLWLRAKLALFAALMACGVGIRFALIRHFTLWAELAAGRGGDAVEAAIRTTYWQATRILILLWLLIGAITWLALTKP